MKVLRVYHGGRDPAHRARERALVAAGVEVTLVVPDSWPGPDELGDEPFDIRTAAVRRPGDVNRHTMSEPAAIRELLASVKPDVVDLHEEPFSSVVKQWLREVPSSMPVVAYSAQNIDKRWPPPFAQYEKSAFRVLRGFYPCSRQAASVLRGKGYPGIIRPLALGIDPSLFRAGQQAHDDEVFSLLLVGRLLPRKGVTDAVRVLADVAAHRPVRLTLVGSGDEAEVAQRLAEELGVADSLVVHAWADAPALAEHYRQAHVVLIPSLATRTWVEQFGRVITEGQASGCVVAGYDNGSIPEVLDGTGVVVTEGDAPGLGRAVVDLAADASRWSSLRRAGLERASSFDWRVVAAGQKSLYEAVLSGSTQPEEATRSSAEREFGTPALVAGGGRPFALPVLREDTPLSRGLARALDALSRGS